MAPRTKKSRWGKQWHWREDVRRLTNDCLAGQLMWLPQVDQIPRHLDPGLDKGCYNHPVVVMSRKPLEDDTVMILLMTSFQGKGLNTRRTTHRVWRNHYYPIEPSPPHPESGIQLRLADGYPSLRRKSYVSMRSGPYAVNLGALRPYGPLGTAPSVLSKKSFQILSEAAQKKEEEDVRALVPENKKTEAKWEKKMAGPCIPVIAAIPTISSTTTVQQQSVLLGMLRDWLFCILVLVYVVYVALLIYMYTL